MAIFEKWKDPGNGLQRKARDMDTAASVQDVDSEHVRAMVLINEISRWLDILSSEGIEVEHHRKQVSKWVRATVAFPVGWDKANGGNSLFTDPMLDSLRSIAPLLDLRRPRVDPRVVSQVPGLLDEVDALLAEDETLPAILVSYLHRLVAECRHAYSDQAVTGSFDLNEAMERLWVALNAAAECSTDKEKQSKWRSFVGKVAPSAVGGLIANAPAVISGFLESGAAG